MHNVKKNQIVVVLLVVMIVVAGYLNYRTENTELATYAGEDSVQSTQELGDSDVTAEGVILPEGEAVAEGETTEETAAEEETPETEEATVAETEEARAPGEAIMVESDAVIPEYFAEAKVERENARAKSQDMLYELMAKEDTPEEEKSEAAQKILELQKRIENEAGSGSHD